MSRYTYLVDSPGVSVSVLSRPRRSKLWALGAPAIRPSRLPFFLHCLLGCTVSFFCLCFVCNESDLYCKPPSLVSINAVSQCKKLGRKSAPCKAQSRHFYCCAGLYLKKGRKPSPEKKKNAESKLSPLNENNNKNVYPFQKLLYTCMCSDSEHHSIQKHCGLYNKKIEKAKSHHHVLVKPGRPIGSAQGSEKKTR